jgi:hypothetical protein
MSGSDEMDFTLEYILSDVRKFLLLHPFMSGASRGPKRAMFIHHREPPDTFDRGPGLCPGSSREAGGANT